jgi:hypothetical protein
VAAPLVSMEALEMLMDEHGQEVTDPAEFVAWAKSLGINLCAPLITTLGVVEEEKEVAAEAKEQAAVGQRLVSMSKRGVSTVLAQILATFASMLSTLSASMSPTLTGVAPAQREHSEAAHVIAQIHEHMLSPLVTVVVPVGNLDGTIDTSVPGVEQIIWVDGRVDEPGGSSDELSSAYVHVAPGGFATVRFREQGPHPQQDDVEDQQPPDQEQRAAAYDSTEELEAFMNQAVHSDDELPHVRRTSALDHARLYAAKRARRYRGQPVDRSCCTCHPARLAAVP